MEADSRASRSVMGARALVGALGVALNTPLLLPFLLSTEKRVIVVDARRWCTIVEHDSRSDPGRVLWLLAHLPEFRDLYYYRLGRGNLAAKALVFVLRFFYRGCPALYFATPNIGPGLFIQHGYATRIGADSVGENCWINQSVVVGHTDKSSAGPVIGNNVTIGAGAKVLGPITIGDNVRVGANAVVLKDVPANCVVVGVPAYIVRRDGIRVKEQQPGSDAPSEGPRPGCQGEAVPVAGPGQAAAGR